MVDILGPADAAGAVTTRPTDDRTFGAVDTWLKDCTSETAEDGTDLRASFFNGIVASLRSVWRSNGKLADNVTPIVSETNSDDAITKAVQYLIQRGQCTFSGDAGTTNHLSASLTPPLREYKAGLIIAVSAANANTASTDISVNGLAPKLIVRRDGSFLQGNDILGGGAISLLAFDGSNFQLISHIFERPTLTAARTYYVAAAGNDANNGLTAGTPFATWQKAVSVIQKLNLNGYPVVVQGLGGTYGAGAYAAGPFFGGGSVTFQGSGDNIVVASGACFEAAYGAEFSVAAGITLQSNDYANGAIKAQFGGLINILGDIHLNACTGYHIGGLDGGQVRLRGGYTVYGGAQAHFLTQGQGRIAKDTSGPIAPGYGGGVNFSIGFAVARTLGFMTLIGFAYSGVPTGPRYVISDNGVISTGGGGASFLPGSSAGTTASGGQYS